ncbi:MAG: hypothetical protein E7472_04660 [Ruminococcaceae bacterium]|nr:hypothetical protein [Oscillospiraceae bacterium]
MIKSYTVTATDLYWLIISVTFLIASVLCSCCWYAKRQHTSFKTALLVLWNDGIVDGFKCGGRSFLPTVKTAASVTWSYTKRLALAFLEYIKPPPPKHVFAPGLYQEIFEIAQDYAYAGFQPVIKAIYTPLPSYLYVSFYTKSAISEELAAEITWHIEAKFQEYQDIYGLCFDSTAIPYVLNNYYELRLYYVEHPAEYTFYRTVCRQAMLLRAAPEFRPLLESDVPPSTDLVLGYRYESWRDSGQIVPIVWDMGTAPFALISGPTGAGKSVYLKSLIEQLLLSGAEITICDFKGYGDLRGFVKNYAEGKDCDAALMAFCDAFERDREAGRRRETRKVLVFDELNSFMLSKSKREADEVIRRISSLVFLSRAYGYNIIWSGQRFGVDVVPSSIRDQFNVKVYLGSSISVQAATMLFPNSEIDKSVRLPPYCGYISTPKTDCDVLITPKLDIPALNRRLKTLGNANS